VCRPSSQVPDVHLDEVGVVVKGPVPDVVEDLAFVGRFTHPAEQVEQQGVLAGCELDFGVAAPTAVQGRVELEVSGGKDDIAVNLLPAQECVQVGHQYHERARLLEVVVCAGLERFGLVPLTQFGSEHQHRCDITSGA
jgi:hypothetical protein